MYFYMCKNFWHKSLVIFLLSSRKENLDVKMKVGPRSRSDVSEKDARLIDVLFISFVRIVIILKNRTISLSV